MSVASTSSSVPAFSGGASASSRLAFLDLTKGILVVLMVAYHGLNYTNNIRLAFRYLSFLPPSFIFITGYLIAIVYYPRYITGNGRLWSRLVSRGAKLLLLFIALNIVAQFVRSPAYGRSTGIAGFFGHWHDIFIMGAGQTAAFEVLLPIAYLLLLAPVLICLATLHALLLPLLSALIVGGCAYLDHRGISIGNLNLLSAGLVGMSVGRLVAKPAVIGQHLGIAALAWLIYYPLSVFKGYIYIMQLVGAFFAIFFWSGVSWRLGETGWWQRRLILLGQYSLVAYVGQIAILQVLSRFVGRPDPLSSGAAIYLLGTLIGTTLIAEGLEWLRRQSRATDVVYRAVFA